MVRSGRPWALRRLYSLVRIAAAVILALILLMVVGFEKRMVYHPTASLRQTPADWKMPYRDVWATARDGVRVHGWWILPRLEGAWAFLWCHGNAGNISNRLENAAIFAERLGVGMLLFDYRGFGRSTGEPNEEGTYLDSRAAHGVLLGQPEVDARRIAYFGRSLGAAVALELALERPPTALIMESAFTSIPDMTATVLPFFPTIVARRLLRTQYDSMTRIARCSCPLLVIHGDDDDVVPYEHGQRLFAAAVEPKRFFTIGGAGHNDTYAVGGETYLNTIRAFLREHDPASDSRPGQNEPVGESRNSPTPRLQSLPDQLPVTR